MWTDATRAHQARAGLALPSDLTDDEWAVLKPFLPPPSGEGGVDVSVVRTFGAMWGVD